MHASASSLFAGTALALQNFGRESLAFMELGW